MCHIGGVAVVDPMQVVRNKEKRSGTVFFQDCAAALPESFRVMAGRRHPISETGWES